MFLFQHNQNQNGIFERIVKLLLSPSQSTFAFFFFIILSLINITTIKRLMITQGQQINNNEDDLDDNNDFTLLLTYSLLFSFKTINNYSFYKWPRLTMTRIDIFKYAIKKCIGKSIRFSLLNIAISLFYYMMKIGTIFVGKMVIDYFIVVFIGEILQYISYEILKAFICAPINPDSYQLHNEIDCVNYPIKFNVENSFTSIHYLLILNEILQRGYYQPKTQLNSMLSSGNVSKEIKMKIDMIYNRLSEKLKMVNCTKRHHHSYMNKDSISEKRNGSGLMSWFDFSKNEVFEQETSPQMIDLLSEVIWNNVMLIATRKNSHCYNRHGNNQYSPEQLYLVYLIETLISFEKKIKEMIKMIENDKGNTVNKAILKHLKVVNERIEMRIKEIIYRNLKERFLVNFGENINEIIKQFRI